MLNEISLLQKEKYCMIPLVWCTLVVKFIEIQSRILAAKVWERRANKYFKRYRQCLDF